MSDVSSRIGGVISASDACEIPRNEQQVTKLKSRIKYSELLNVHNLPFEPSDELAVVLHQAFMEDKSDQFIRAVQCYREPAIVVATERQLNDLVRFCTVLGKGSIMTIDPTFSLGDFDVTVITYRHTMLSSRQSKQPPGMIGPVMVHYRKTLTSSLAHHCWDFVESC